MSAWRARLLAAFTSIVMVLGTACVPVQSADAAPLQAIASVSVEALPPQVRETLRLIHAGGPFPYARDGVSFGNFERRLPIEKPHFYREYTVPTPGARDRGARRVIAGREGEFFYTDDHYSTFRRILE